MRAYADAAGTALTGAVVERTVRYVAGNTLDVLRCISTAAVLL